MAAQPLPVRPGPRLRRPVEITPAKRDTIESWRQRLRAYTPQPQAYPDDPYIYTTCLLAYEAVQEGDFGIGCLILDSNGNTVAAGHNELFKPYFRSDRHGEMVVMDAWEEAIQRV
jgi:cytosine deaminase